VIIKSCVFFVSLLGMLIFKPCHFAVYYSLIVEGESSMKKLIYVSICCSNRFAQVILNHRVCINWWQQPSSCSSGAHDACVLMRRCAVSEADNVDDLL